MRPIMTEPVVGPVKIIGMPPVVAVRGTQRILILFHPAVGTVIARVIVYVVPPTTLAIAALMEDTGDDAPGAMSNSSQTGIPATATPVSVEWTNPLDAVKVIV